MIEVKGTDKIGEPQIISFDRRVLEVFSRQRGKVVSRRFHVDHLTKLEIQERGNKPPILYLELNFPAAFAIYEFKEGAENLNDLADAVNQKMTSVF